MKHKNYTWLLLLACTGACTTTSKTTRQPVRQVNEAVTSLNADTLTPGLPAYGATTVQYSRAGKQVLTVQLKEPVVLDVATKPEKWGYFQFPHIDRAPDNTVRVRWNLNDDAMEA